MGMPPENIFIGDVGSVVEIHEDYMKQLPDVQAGAVMVDGLGVGDVGSIVLRDRKHLAEDGLIIAVCTIEAGSGRVVSRSGYRIPWICVCARERGADGRGETACQQHD